MTFAKSLWAGELGDGSESFNNINVGANRHSLARIKSPCIIILLPTPCLTYRVSIFTSIDHEEALFNPNCRILHLLEDIKRRCNCAENGLWLVWVKLLVLFCAQIATASTVRGVTRILQRGGHTLSNRWYPLDCHVDLHAVFYLMGQKRLTKGVTGTPGHHPPPPRQLRPWPCVCTYVGCKIFVLLQNIPVHDF